MKKVDSPRRGLQITLRQHRAVWGAKLAAVLSFGIITSPCPPPPPLLRRKNAMFLSTKIVSVEFADGNSSLGYCKSMVATLPQTSMNPQKGACIDCCFLKRALSSGPC